MAREAKGELRRLADGWEARVTIEGRQRIGLMLTFTHEQEALAEQRPDARSYCNSVSRLKGVLATKTARFAGYPREGKSMSFDSGIVSGDLGDGGACAAGDICICRAASMICGMT